MVAKRSNASAGCVLEKLEVVECASTTRKPCQDLFPPPLLLVAMGKVDESVLEGELFIWQLLQPNDDAVCRRRLVGALVDQCCTSLLKLLVFEDAGIVGVCRTALDEYWVAGIEQLLDCGGCEA